MIQDRIEIGNQKTKMDRPIPEQGIILHEAPGRQFVTNKKRGLC
jgi:hypothetical protein